MAILLTVLGLFGQLLSDEPLRLLRCAGWFFAGFLAVAVIGAWAKTAISCFVQDEIRLGRFPDYERLEVSLNGINLAICVGCGVLFSIQLWLGGFFEADFPLVQAKTLTSLGIVLCGCDLGALGPTYARTSSRCLISPFVVGRFYATAFVPIMIFGAVACKLVGHAWPMIVVIIIANVVVQRRHSTHWCAYPTVAHLALTEHLVATSAITDERAGSQKQSPSFFRTAPFALGVGLVLAAVYCAVTPDSGPPRNAMPPQPGRNNDSGIEQTDFPAISERSPETVTRSGISQTRPTSSPSLDNVAHSTTAAGGQQTILQSPLPLRDAGAVGVVAVTGLNGRIYRIPTASSERLLPEMDRLSKKRAELVRAIETLKGERERVSAQEGEGVISANAFGGRVAHLNAKWKLLAEQVKAHEQEEEQFLSTLAREAIQPNPRK